MSRDIPISYGFQLLKTSGYWYFQELHCTMAEAKSKAEC